MWRFLPGVILLQLVTLLLVWVARDQPWQQQIVSAGVPAALFGLVTALWFASIGRSLAERALSKLQMSHARERERWQQQSARSEQSLRREAQQNLERQHKRVHRGANLKVGMAFTLAAGAGVLLLLSPLVTLGLLTLCTASGALAGYMLRGRRKRARALGGTGMAQQTDANPSQDRAITGQLVAPESPDQSRVEGTPVSAGGRPAIARVVGRGNAQASVGSGAQSAASSTKGDVSA